MRKDPGRMGSPTTLRGVRLLGSNLAACFVFVLLFASTLAASAAAAVSNRLGPPTAEGPVTVSLGLFVSDVNEIDERGETFAFEAILTLKWRDPRQAFDPAEEGVSVRSFQGAYQFSEIYDGWWPQLILANESGDFDSQAVLLRIEPDGAMTLIMEIDAAAEMPMQLRRFPFDHQRLEARFEVLGFGDDQVRLVPDPGTSGVGHEGVQIAQWEFDALHLEARTYQPTYNDGRDGELSRVVAIFEMTRQPAHMIQVVVLPLTVLVILTFSVFWMDHESLGDRMDISFIGILTVVAYQIIVSDAMPGIAYFTLMSAFLLSTYFVLAIGVVVNLVVARFDRSGRRPLGDRLDRTCRWLVPIAFFGVNALSASYFFLFH